MGNALAIAAVTCVLKNLLNDGVVAASDMVGAITVTALPPDKAVEAAAQTNSINLFLYQVTPNQGWSSTDLPTRDSRGELVANPRLALNLHYLLTVFGTDELHSEVLLGYAMLLLHQNPVLGREGIRQTFSNAFDTSMLPRAYQALAASDLADQVELVKITPERLDTDHVSKLWTAFQTHYRLSTAYEVSVVLIEGQMKRRTPLPVLTRGAPDPVTQRETGIVVQPSLMPPFPTLEAIQPANNQTAARVDEIVTLLGHDLSGSPGAVHFRDPRTGSTISLTPETTATSTAVPVKLIANGNWRAGVYLVSVAIGSGSTARTTNEMPMILAPAITVTASRLPQTQLVAFEVTCVPDVSSAQRISLIVGTSEIDAEPLQSNPTGPILVANMVRFVASGLTAGQNLPLRLRVDGAESILIDRSSSPPSFYSSQYLVVP